MNARGFALLAVLWVLTALSVLAGAALAGARTGAFTTRNRVLLARAGWAREACAEILLARYPDNRSIRATDPVDLGRGTWCRATIEDPGAKLNINLASREALVVVLSAVSGQPSVDSLADALLDWRDPDTMARPFGLETPHNRNGALADVSELRYVRGYDDSLVARLSRVLTTRGTGLINVAGAPRQVLRSVPGMSAEAVAVLLHRRESGIPVRSADELAGLLSSAGRATLYASYPEFVRSVTFAPVQLIALVEGGVSGTPIVARATLTMVPVVERLAVVRRETE